MKISNILEEDLIIPEIGDISPKDILKKLVTILKQKDRITDGNSILKKLIERETLASTSIGNNTAIPHTKVKELKKPIVVLAISKKGLNYNEKDEEPVNLIALILSPANAPALHLQILAATASLIKKRGNLIKEMVKAKDSSEILEIIRKYEESDD